MDQDEPCLAPQLCIRCRSYDLGRHVAVVSNADPCTCTDDETCPHNKKTNARQLLVLRKKISLQHQQAPSITNEGSKTIGRDVESDEDDDDDCSSSSSSSTTSCSSCSSDDTTTSESEDNDSITCTSVNSSQ
ncbi:unnamed protein product [Aphis gossypii]|uniref:Uncharacterized protein n=1 Tax=Aphis gossypii TaxID=80765 RepID=A0A9P0ITZ4_APHGO|nr:unnamed protein product [Aphis gossypii]